jgi:hypothetical protein
MADYATLLRDQVTLTCRSIDRTFLQAYVPKLQSVGMVCNFLCKQRGFAIPSGAAFGRIGRAYVEQGHRWAKANDVPVHYFAKGENKEQPARPLLEAAAKQAGRVGWCWSGSRRSGRRCGARGRPRATSTAPTRTWSGVGRWRL